MGVPAYKIGSGECNNYPLVQHIAGFGKPVILSTGMNDIREHSRRRSRSCARRGVPFALMHCTSMYPTPYDKVRLGGDRRAPGMRFPTPSSASAIIRWATTPASGPWRSARASSRSHFTSDKTWPGPDVPISMDPAELRGARSRLARRLRGARRRQDDPSRKSSRPSTSPTPASSRSQPLDCRRARSRSPTSGSSGPAPARSRRAISSACSAARAARALAAHTQVQLERFALDSAVQLRSSGGVALKRLTTLRLVHRGDFDLAEPSRRSENRHHAQRDGCALRTWSRASPRSAKALFVAAAAQARPQGVVLYVLPERRRPRGGVRRRRRSFWRALEGLRRPRSNGRACRSLARSRSLPRAGAARRRDVGPRARAPWHRARHGRSSSRRRPRCCRACRRPIACSPPSLDLRPGQDIRADRSGRAARRRRLHPRRSRPTSTENSPSAAASWTFFRPARRIRSASSSSATRSRSLRTYDPSTQRSIAPIDQVVIVPLRDVLQDNRGATVFDYLSRARDSRIVVSEADEVAANAIRLFENLQHSYERPLSRKERYAPPPPSCLRTWQLVESRLAQATQLAAARARRRSTPRVRLEIAPEPDWLRAPRACRGANPESRPSRSPRASRPQPAGDRDEGPRRRLGGRASVVSRDDGETTLFVAATPGRAERTIEVLKEYDVFAVPVERAEDARYAARPRRRRRAVARVQAAGRRPANLRRGGRLRGGAPRARTAPVRDQGVPVRPSRSRRSATSSSTSITASACSSG